jgi:hypothetical protein
MYKGTTVSVQKTNSLTHLYINFLYYFADKRHDPENFGTYDFEGPDNLPEMTVISLCLFES